MKAVVTGAIATFPVGGVAWDYGQYALAMEQLGYEVWYLEDTGVVPYDNVARTYHDDPTAGLEHLRRSLAALSPTLAERWHLVDVRGDRHGCPASELSDVLADADVLLNVSGVCQLRPEYATCRRTIMIDTDPGWTHWVALPRTEDRDPDDGVLSWRAHDEFATYATALGHPGCVLPDLGVDWIRTVPPVVTDRWIAGPPPSGAPWSTVLTWDNYAGGFEHAGVTYGSKASEFDRIATLPSRTGRRHELAVGGVRPPVDAWRQDGWGVVDGPATTASMEAYRDYLVASRGECGPAKHVYVASGSGWFSCRTVCYLAAGRPAVVQDTGWSAHLPSGEGLFSYGDLDDAVSGISAAEADPSGHAEAARALAEDRFEGTTVLADLLDRRSVMA